MFLSEREFASRPLLQITAIQSQLTGSL